MPKGALHGDGAKRLKLQYDEQLSVFAFKFKVRRSNKEQANAIENAHLGPGGRSDDIGW